jgi:hypothetical protein
MAHDEFAQSDLGSEVDIVESGNRILLFNSDSARYSRSYDQ